MKILVGHTGFVGSNLAGQQRFDGLYNSQNIAEAYGAKPELLIYAGVRAEKYLANKEPEKDFSLIREAFTNIQKIAPQKVVLISTVDVYKNPRRVNEDTVIETDGLQTYGLHRYQLEQMVAASGLAYSIIRLPGLFGKNIKKNFIFDLINVIPAMLTENKMSELSAQDPQLLKYYQKLDNGFYKLQNPAPELREMFKRLGFSAVNFTDSRAVFQFYNLEHLWQDICFALDKNISVLNLAAEPLAAAEIYAFRNEITQNPPYYDFRTKYTESGYFYSKKTVLAEIQNFLKEHKCN